MGSAEGDARSRKGFVTKAEEQGCFRGRPSQTDLAPSLLSRREADLVAGAGIITGESQAPCPCLKLGQPTGICFPWAQSPRCPLDFGELAWGLPTSWPWLPDGLSVSWLSEGHLSCFFSNKSSSCFRRGKMMFGLFSALSQSLPLYRKINK